MTFLQKLLKVRKKVLFRKPDGAIGECWPHMIVVDIAFTEISPAQIYLHELIHSFKPHWGEKRVLAMEKVLWKRITPRERHALYGKLFRHPYLTKGDDDE